MLHPSHTHSAPRTALEFADRPGGISFRSIALRSADLHLADRRGARALAPATLTWRAGHCALAFNRDLYAPDGRVLCGLNPSAKSDDTLLVGRVVTPPGRSAARS